MCGSVILEPKALLKAYVMFVLFLLFFSFACYFLNNVHFRTHSIFAKSKTYLTKNPKNIEHEKSVFRSRSRTHDTIFCMFLLIL